MLSVPAIVLAVVYGLLLILTAIIGYKQITPLSVFFYILSIGMAALVVYDTSCLTQGECTIWSWIRTVLYAIVPILTVVFIMIAVLSTNKHEDEEK